jgi:DNA-binding NtrC family response regulator
MSKEKILIVDDDDGVREILADFLDVLGYQSVGACDGRDALNLLKKHQISLVISDIKMPGMDGHEMVEKIKRERADIDVILITGLEPHSSHSSLKEAFTWAYLSKPFNIDTIEKKVRSVMDKRNELRGSP